MESTEGAPLLVAPSIAAVTEQQKARPPYLRDRPLAVDERLFHDARAELERIMEDRGWALPVDEDLSRKGIENFLLWGHPVVIAA